MRIVCLISEDFYTASLLQSCVKVALDFVSPENVDQCMALTEEFRQLPMGHRAKEDKLGVSPLLLSPRGEMRTLLLLLPIRLLPSD